MANSRFHLYALLQTFSMSHTNLQSIVATLGLKVFGRKLEKYVALRGHCIVGTKNHVLRPGYAFVEPPAELRACFDEMERCGAILKRHHPFSQEMYFKKNFSPEPPHNSPVARPHDMGKRVQRSCAVLAVVNAALSKATNHMNRAFDVAAFTTPSSSSLQCVVAQLKEQFAWIEEQDFINHPTAQALADHIMQIEASQRECREFLASGELEAPEALCATHEPAGHVLTHTEVRCLEIRIQCCGKHACSILDTTCRLVHVCPSTSLRTCMCTLPAPTFAEPSNTETQRHNHLICM